MALRFQFLQPVAMDKKIQVILGSHGLRLFFVPSKDFHSIGIVKIGMEFGILAQTPDGDYFRINGSDIQKLRTRDIERAIQIAKSLPQVQSSSQCPAKDEAPSSVHLASVSRKKRRRIDMRLVEDIIKSDQ